MFKDMEWVGWFDFGTLRLFEKNSYFCLDAHRRVDKYYGED